ncbi:MAG: hypothetical protein ACRDWY_16065 [Actinomycetes bacterium]
MSQAICENGHALSSGQSRCEECGARIRMQWMKDEDPGKSFPRSSQAPAPATVRPSAPQQSAAGGQIWGWLAAGILFMIIGLVVLIDGISSLIDATSAADAEAALDEFSTTIDDSGSGGAQAAIVIGSILAAVGAFMVQVATIAKGVELGNRASS